VSVVDPFLNVALSVAKVLADPETRWALSAISPRIDGCYRHIEMVGEVIHCKQPLEGVHAGILRNDPLNRM
jgi:hypothetical protein